MTARHCPGCRGYTHGWDAICPGVEVSALAEEFVFPDVVPPLPLRSRLKVLLGRPLFLGVSPGPLGEPFTEVAADPAETSEFWAGPDYRHWKDAG